MLLYIYFGDVPDLEQPGYWNQAKTKVFFTPIFWAPLLFWFCNLCSTVPYCFDEVLFFFFFFLNKFFLRVILGQSLKFDSPLSLFLLDGLVAPILCFTSTFVHQVYVHCLGRDRAYRRFWVFDSLPGIFVEHDDDNVSFSRFLSLKFLFF